MKTSSSILFKVAFVLFSTVSAIPLNLVLNPSLFLPNSSLPVTARGVYCFRQLPHDVHPATDDCLKAIDKIFADPDLTKTKTWAVRRPQTAAMEWEHGTCKIAVGVWTPAAPATALQDRFSLWTCAEKAQRIVQECLGTGKVGGRSEIGPKGIFQILVRQTRDP